MRDYDIDVANLSGVDRSDNCDAARDCGSVPTGPITAAERTAIFEKCPAIYRDRVPRDRPANTRTTCTMAINNVIAIAIVVAIDIAAIVAAIVA